MLDILALLFSTSSIFDIRQLKVWPIEKILESKLNFVPHFHQFDLKILQIHIVGQVRG